MSEAPDIVLFVGRFHPLLVHLPIGFLFFAFILKVFALWKGNKTLSAAIPLALFMGTISAFTACVLGYMLSLSGDYQEEALDIHFWFGVATTTIAFLAWLISIGKIKTIVLQQSKSYIAILSLIVILLSITGHFGGNLTHGSDYLTAYLPFGKKKKSLPINSIEEAQIFNHLVFPILDRKCMSCHNDSKKNGQLSLASKKAIIKGGKSGPVLVAGKPSKSEIIRRVLLNPHDKKFMPSKGKTPLTKEEISIINYWIEQGNGSFDATINTVDTPNSILILAHNLLGFDANGKQKAVLSKGATVSPEIIAKLRNSGFKIRELIAESNLFDISLPANNKYITEEKLSEIMNLLLKINKNIIWLSLPANNIKDEHLKIIAKFQNLKKLRLEKNPITDIGIKHLLSLQNLESLNIYQTDITNSCIPTLSQIKNLQKVYVWGTGIDKEKIPKTSNIIYN